MGIITSIIHLGSGEMFFNEVYVVHFAKHMCSFTMEHPLDLGILATPSEIAK